MKRNSWNQAMCSFFKTFVKKKWKNPKSSVFQKGFPCYGSLFGKIHPWFEYFMTLRDRAPSAVLWALSTRKQTGTFAKPGAKRLDKRSQNSPSVFPNCGGGRWERRSWFSSANKRQKFMRWKACEWICAPKKRRRRKKRSHLWIYSYVRGWQQAVNNHLAATCVESRLSEG